MKKKALFQDFKMEIKKNISRFCSILLIVVLGVAFFAGIRSTEPDMLLSADEFYDDYNLMDIRILSTLGLTQEDVDEISKVEGVKKIEPVYGVDVLHKTESLELVIKVISRTKDINQIRITEGRLPEKSTECLVDQQLIEYTDYKIGDNLKLDSGNLDPLEDSLNSTEFTIVGYGTSPYYLSIEKGSSSIGNGKLNNFIIVPKEAFNMEAYSEIYVAVEGAKELSSYSSQYEDRVERVLNNIEEIADTRREARFNQVLEEPLEEIAKAKEKLLKEETKGQSELAEGALKITDAKAELSDGENLLQEGKEELVKGKKEIKKNKIKLIEAESELKSGKSKLEDGKKKLLEGSSLLKEKRKEYEIGLSSIENGYTQYNTGLEKWNKENSALLINEKVLLSGIEELNLKKTELEPVKEMYQDEWETILSTQANLNEQLEKLNHGKTQLEKAKLELTTSKSILDKEKEKLNQGNILLTKEENKILSAKATLQEKSKEIKKGEIDIKSGWNEIKKAEKEIQEAEVLLNEKTIELNNGRKTLEEKEKEYNDGLLEFEEKIADAKEKIADGEIEISKVEYPKWYVLDRGSIQPYVEYGEDSKRIGNIGKVFPAIFFLVAALISLTSMTRMVEEQRTQIGTLKALGYSKGDIARKFLLYGFLASIIGSILGVLIGETVLPSVIIKAYTLIYENLPNIKTPINMYYGLMATAIAVLCTTLATLLACFKELLTSPAQLMRPASPKLGKRVFLERINWLWKRLNFTQKSTIRNLFRYKKRFFMTVFGIGGCTALLLVGFGLKDSIGAMSEIQYSKVWHQDLIVSVNDKADLKQKEELYEYLISNTNIEDFTFVKQTSIDVSTRGQEKSGYLFVPKDTEQIKDYITMADRVTKEVSVLEDEGVIITEKLASLLGVSVGDEINLKNSEFSRKKVVVTGIVENYITHYIFMSPIVYERLYNQEPIYNNIYIKNHDDNNSSQERTVEELLKLEGVSSISLTSELQEKLEDMLDSLNIVVFVLIISAGLLAFVVLYNLNNINITERVRELATLKVLGFYDMEVATYVYRENTILTLVGSITGIFLGIILHRFVILTAETDFIMFGRNIKTISYVFGVILTFVFAAFVNFMMYYKLKKIDMVESLKSIE